MMKRLLENGVKKIMDMSEKNDTMAEMEIVGLAMDGMIQACST